MKKWFAQILCAAICIVAGIATAYSINLNEAKWIGAPHDALPLYAYYLPVFRIDCDVEIEAGGKASIIYGANDPRLMNRNLNIYNIESGKGESKIKVEIDTAGKVRIFRVGYHPDDHADRPIAEFDAEIRTEGINELSILSNSGHTDVLLNGRKIGYKGVNPVGNGGDYISFPVVADLGVEIAEGSKARISNLTIRNYREPGNVIAKTEGDFTSTSTIKLPERSMPELRSTIRIPEGRRITKATAYATARGIYDLSINGKRATDAYFYPGSTQYNKTHLYQTFDILPLLQAGENEIRVQLGEGWWSGGATYMTECWNFFGDRQSFAALLRIEYADGTHQDFVTDPKSWEVSTDGPLKGGSFFQGEIFDATLTNSGRQTWRKAVEISTDTTTCRSIGSWEDVEFVADYGNDVAAVDTLTAVSMTEPRPGVYVYDLGQNIAGVPLIEFENLQEGQRISLRHSEVLYPDMEQYRPNAGMIMTENLRVAMNHDQYVGCGAERETYSPRFTLHGFRYIEITGIKEALPPTSVRAIALSSVHDIKAHYECSDTLVNRLWENIIWSTRGNFISIPTDCPQRNERLGWMGDISVYAATATKLADVSALLRQYLRSVRDCQEANGRYPDVAPTGVGFGGLLWGSAGITVPYEHFAQYGDTTLLREHYDSMVRYMDYLLNETIDPTTGIIVQSRQWGDLGDWLSPEYDKTDKSLLWECYYIYDLGIMREIAATLGYDEDAKRFERMHTERIEHFKRNYIDPESERTIHSQFEPTKAGKPVDTAVSYVLPIAMGIYNSDKFKQNLTDAIERENVSDDGTICPPYSLMTGFIGTARIADALSAAGREDIAYRMLTNRAYPSWLYPVTQGATTIWERLNSYTHRDGFGQNNSMNSFNHYSFGAIGNWLLTHSLGIRTATNGSIEIEPEPDPTGCIKYAKGRLETKAGKIESEWETDGSTTTFRIGVPEGVSAVLIAGGERIPLKPGRNSITLPCKLTDTQTKQ